MRRTAQYSTLGRDSRRQLKPTAPLQRIAPLRKPYANPSRSGSPNLTLNPNPNNQLASLSKHLTRAYTPVNRACLHVWRMAFAPCTCVGTAYRACTYITHQPAHSTPSHIKATLHPTSQRVQVCGSYRLAPSSAQRLAIWRRTNGAACIGSYICPTHISLRNHPVGSLGARCGH